MRRWEGPGDEEEVTAASVLLQPPATPPRVTARPAVQASRLGGAALTMHHIQLPPAPPAVRTGPPAPHLAPPAGFVGRKVVHPAAAGGPPHGGARQESAVRLRKSACVCACLCCPGVGGGDDAAPEAPHADDEERLMEADKACCSCLCLFGAPRRPRGARGGAAASPRRIE